jgi:hypothetical protein
MAQLFKDKAILDCSEVVLQISLFIEDTTTKDKSHSSTAETSPNGGGGQFSSIDTFSL